MIATGFFQKSGCNVMSGCCTWPCDRKQRFPEDRFLLTKEFLLQYTFLESGKAKCSSVLRERLNNGSTSGYLLPLVEFSLIMSEYFRLV